MSTTGRKRAGQIFAGPKEPDRGYTVTATALEDTEHSRGDAVVEIFKDGQVVRAFEYPAYRVWNIAAHFGDIVDGEIVNHDGGYRAADWNGLTPTGEPQPLRGGHDD
jgi:hypothetical protein